MSYMDKIRQLKIQLEDVKAATNNFGDKPIGTGGFGAVYKGELLLPEGRRMVAFKRLDRLYGQGDKEFLHEIVMLSTLRHENLASLLCFCEDDNERILVSEYASHQSLDRHLDKASLTWTQRLHICLGAARGIAYLHDPKDTHHRVIHRNIKSSNILLDDKWTAKVSDFGLSKFAPANQQHSFLVTNIVGTPGYNDPMYYNTGVLSKESDVYSFGVVLFEVMCGRLCYEFDEGKLIAILVHLWKSRYDQGRLDDIVFGDLKPQMNQESLSTFAAIAGRCLNREIKKRPTMVEVVKELEVALHHQQNFKEHESKVGQKPTAYEFLEEFDHLKVESEDIKHHNSKEHESKKPTLYEFLEEFGHLKVRLEDIELATNNFSKAKEIGRGGFGPVYKGELSLPDGNSTVGIKRLDRKLGQGDDEFRVEILILSKYKHENLVSLLNICIEDGEMILVYNYASRGSLNKYIGKLDFTWTQRLKVSVDVARALSYLHDPRDTKHIVLHRDIKSANILLYEDWTAKVSDFGLSKLAPANQTDLVSNVVGTSGYCDPHYLKTGILTKESDVYSFGVVLFELMCGKLCFEYANGNLTVFVRNWIASYNECKLDEIILPDLKEEMGSCSLNTFSTIAYRCLMRAPKERPTMAEVMKELMIALKQQEDFEKRRIQNHMISPLYKASRSIDSMRFPKGVLVGDGNTWFSLLENGNVYEVISATKCISADSVVQDNTQNSRFSNVVKGGMYNGFTVNARTQFLSPKATYAVCLVFKHNGTDRVRHIPFKFKVDRERYFSNSCMTNVRDDGWLMTELYQFKSYRGEHDLRIQFLPLYNIASSSIEYFLEGIEFRPVQYVS